MRTTEKENKVPARRLPRLSKTPGQKSPHIRFSLHNTSRDLTITAKLLQDITGKPNLSLVTTLNLQFKDERFPKIKRITGLEAVPNLKSLDMSFNMIEKIEGLSGLGQLLDLNLSENCIDTIENLDKLKKLQRLNLAGNRIESIGQGLGKLMELQCIKLERNRIRNIKEVLKLSTLPKLSQLSLKGNPVVNENDHLLEFCVFHIKGLEIFDGEEISERTKRKSRISASPLETRELCIEDNKFLNQSRKNLILSDTGNMVKGIFASSKKPIVTTFSQKKRKLKELRAQASSLHTQIKRLNQEVMKLKETMKSKEYHLLLLRKQMSERSVESYLSDADGFFVQEEKASAEELLELEQLVTFKEQELEKAEQERDILTKEIAMLEAELILTEKGKKHDLDDFEDTFDIKDPILEEQCNATCEEFIMDNNNDNNSPKSEQEKPKETQEVSQQTEKLPETYEQSQQTEDASKAAAIENGLDTLLSLFAKHCNSDFTEPEDRILSKITSLQNLIMDQSTKVEETRTELEDKVRENNELREQLVGCKEELALCVETEKALNETFAADKIALEAKYEHLQGEFQNCKQQAAMQEATILEQNERIEQLIAENEKQSKLKEKIEGYKEQVEELQMRLEKLGESLMENIKRSRSFNLCKAVSENELPEALKDKIVKCESEITSLKEECEKKQVQYDELLEKYQDSLNTNEKPHPPETIKKLLHLNKYLENALHKNPQKASALDPSISSIIDNSAIGDITAELSPWDTVTQFVTNVKQYIRKMRKYKQQLKELKSTKDSFLKYVEQQVSELTKSWDLLGEKEKENQEFMQQLVQKEDELREKAQKGFSGSKVRKEELERAVFELEKKKARLLEEIERMQREQANSQIIVENCKKAVETRMAEVEDLKYELEEIGKEKESIIQETKTIHTAMAKDQEKLMTLKKEIEKHKTELNKMMEEKETKMKSICKLEHTEKELRKRLQCIESMIVETEKQLNEKEAKSQRTEEQKYKQLEYITKLVAEKDSALTRMNNELSKKEEKLKKCKAELKKHKEDLLESSRKFSSTRFIIGDDNE